VDVRVKLGFLLVVLAAVAGLLWSLGLGFPRAPEPVDAVRVRRGDFQVTLAVSGVVDAEAVDLAFPLAGRLRRVVEEGQPVAAGQVLAELEAGELEADLEQARQARRAAEEEVARAGAQASASVQEVRRARAGLEAARAQAQQALAAWSAAQARLAELRASPKEAEVRQAEAAAEAARAAWEETRRALEVQEQLFREGATSQAQLEAARAQQDAARARYQQAQAHLDRVRQGPGQEVLWAAEEQVKQARSAYLAARAQEEQALAAWSAAQAAARQAQVLVRAARARAAQAAAAERAAAQRLQRATLKAPFAGTVTRVYVRQGATVSPGVPVLTVAGPARWVTAEVDEADVGKVRVGQEARVSADAYPGLRLTARVTQVAGQVETRPGSRVVRVRLDLSQPLPLRVGTGVDVDVVLRTVRGALLVPVESVVSAADGGNQVYVIEGGVVRVRQVRTADRNEDTVVVADGLQEGDLVAVAEPGKLRDGQRVRVRSVR
jgi:RND family efflux transporter MFP subunit